MSGAGRGERAGAWLAFSTYLNMHLLHGPSLDVADGTGGPLLELDLLKGLVQVNSIVAGRGLYLCLLSHLKIIKIIHFKATGTTLFSIKHSIPPLPLNQSSSPLIIKKSSILILTNFKSIRI